MKIALSNRSKTIFFILQLLFVGVVFVLWFTFESIQTSKSLWILFLCAFPSNFISGIIPFDPMVIYFGKYHPIFWVIFVGVVSTLLVEGINYSVLTTISNLKCIVQIRESRFVKKIINLFHNSPFLAIVIAGLLPLPFYPFRMLVIFSGYPFLKYLLALLISKTLRMSCLVLIGHQLNIPDHLIFSIFIGIIIITYASVFIRSFLKRVCCKDKSDRQ